MPTIEAQCEDGASSILETPPFRHCYSNPPPVQPAPQRRAIGASQGCISEVPEEHNAEPPDPSDPGDGDDDSEPDPESGTNSEADDPIPNPNPNASGRVSDRMVSFSARAKSQSMNRHNYVLSFLKGTALDYFEPFLIDDLANKTGWLTNFKYFTKELYIYFGPYNQQAEAEIELEQLVMKDNHKATKFFVDFTEFRLCLTTMTRLSC
jgi:hypothetical protein